MTRDDFVTLINLCGWTWHEAWEPHGTSDDVGYEVFIFGQQKNGASGPRRIKITDNDEVFIWFDYGNTDFKGSIADGAEFFKNNWSDPDGRGAEPATTPSWR